MKVETGYLYHIKEEFFKKYNDGTLMVNHDMVERGQHTLLLKMMKYYGLYH